MRRLVPAAAGLVLLAAGCGGDGNTPTTAAAEVGTTATVERMDLVDRESLDGTLGYADAGRLAAGVAGTVTGLREPGAVITRGHSMYDIDGAAAAFLMYGELPAWRDFEPGMDKGADVRQLERNLSALGHDPGSVDRTWTADTTAAVLRFQRARGLTEDGTLAQGEIVFRPGETRMGEAKAEVGQRVQPGAELGELSSTRREVTVELQADRQELVRAGDEVTVELPNGSEGRGRIAEVGKVAQSAGEDAEPTITVRIELRGRAARGTGLDQAPVDVGFARERRRGVLAVPVTALVARAGGGFAVEAVEPSGRRLVPVEAGLYADDYVEVSGSGLREGLRVVSAE